MSLLYWPQSVISSADGANTDIMSENNESSVAFDDSVDTRTHGLGGQVYRTCVWDNTMSESGVHKVGVVIAQLY